MLPSRALSGLLRTSLADLDRLMRRVHRKAEPEPIHDLRVLTRRLRSLARLTDQDAKTFRGALRNIGRALSPCRAIDVARADAREFGIELDAEALRKKAAQDVRRATRRTRRDEVLALGRWLAQSFTAVDTRVDLPVGLARSIKPSTPKPRLHRFRIEVKKCRYALETLARLGLAPEAISRRMRDIQSELGRAHDLEVLRQLARRTRSSLPRKIEARLKLLERRHIQEALRHSRSVFGARR